MKQTEEDAIAILKAKIGVALATPECREEKLQEYEAALDIGIKHLVERYSKKYGIPFKQMKVLMDKSGSKEELAVNVQEHLN